MALPILKSATACADFGRTVQPYFSQLNDLPRQIYQSATDLQALKAIYLNTNPLVSAFAFSLFLVPIFLVISEINRNYSQVDRVWSILPTVYNLHYVTYAHAKNLPTQRLNSLAIISVIWSGATRSALKTIDGKSYGNTSILHSSSSLTSFSSLWPKAYENPK
ncbi:MAG: hypothetical protein Q9177_004743 [Variospora cf. flavescens]